MSAIDALAKEHRETLFDMVTELLTSYKDFAARRALLPFSVVSTKDIRERGAPEFPKATQRKIDALIEKACTLHLTGSTKAEFAARDHAILKLLELVARSAKDLEFHKPTPADQRRVRRAQALRKHNELR